MSLPFFSKNSTDQNRFLTATITSDAVKVLAFYKDNNNLKIIGSSKQLLDPGKVRAGSIISVEDVAAALENAVANATQELEQKIDNVIFGISGDLCLGIMTTIRAKRGRAASINEKEIEELYNKIEESAAMQAQNEIMQINGVSDTELSSITSSNVYTKIDGQKVNSLNNKTGYMVEAAVFNAFVPTYHLQALQEISKKAGLKILAIGSGIYCLAQTILKANPDLADFVVMEIDGDYTNVAVVFGKGIVATRTLNVGFRHYVEGISERMGLTITEAEKMLKSYCAAKLTTSESVIVQNALRATLEIWMSGIELLFAEYTGVKTFASKIFVTGEGTGVPDLWTMLTNQQWTKSIPFKAEPEFKKLSFLDLNKITDATGKIASAEWLPTTCLSLIYLEMQGENNDQN